MENQAVIELIQELAGLGIKIISAGDSLKISAPAGSLNSELQQKIRDNKAALITCLSSSNKDREKENQLRAITPQPNLAGKPFPLSDLQLGFYMANDPHMEFHVRPHCYSEQDRDSLDIAAYQRAWNKALKRHQASLYVVNAELNLEAIEQPAEINCEINDLRKLDSKNAIQALEEYRNSLKRRELPLDSWPWFELSVSIWLVNGCTKYRVHYNHNNFFIDGFATNQLLHEIENYYQNPDVKPPPLELAYRDAVLAINELEHSSRGKLAKQYWLDRLANLPPPPPLPQKPGLNRRCRAKLNRRERTLSATQWGNFKRHASQNKVTPSNAVIAAYAYILSTWSGTDDFILSQMVTRRFAELHPEIKSVLGNFASLYPLHICLQRDRSFRDNAGAIQAQVLQDIKHLFYGGMQVFQELNRLKGGFGEAPSPFVVGSGLFIKDYKKFDYVLLETSQTILDHQFFEFEDGSYFFVWDVLEEFFPSGVVDSMFNAFSQLLLHLSENAHCWIDPSHQIVPLTADTHQNEESAASIALNDEDQLLHTYLPRSAHCWPDAVAVVGESSLRYGKLDSFSCRIAAKLRKLGVANEQAVAVVANRGSEMIASVFGILKAAGFYVPVDPSLPTARRNLLIEDTGANVVLTQEIFKSSFDWPADVTVIAVDEFDFAAEDSTEELIAHVQPDQLAYVIYTSGTTGRPKGVMIEHGSAMNTIADINQRFQVNHQDVIFGVSAFNFDLSVYDIFGAVAVGAKLVFPNPQASLDVDHWVDLVSEHGVTIWNSVPALMSLLVEEVTKRKETLLSLRLVMLSGDKIPTNLPQEIARVAPNAKIISLGGATEASIWSIIYPIAKHEQFVNSVPYGYPMLNQSWYIRDSRGNDVPDWVVGELMIGGVGLARGYWNDLDKTEQSFIVDSSSGQRLYKTGDLGRFLPDGCLEIFGRKDFQVKIQGHRIELGEIESTLLERIDVKKAVVCVRQLQQGMAAQLVAYLVMKNGIEANQKAITADLQNVMPSYMVPTSIVELESLPRSSNGKVDRQALVQIKPAEDHPAAGAGKQQFRAPQSDDERVLVEIWQRILKVDRIGIDDDFFELGGQSFDAIRIFSEIKDKYSRLFTLGDIWQSRTIALFAKNLQHSTEDSNLVSLIELVKHKKGREIFLVHPAGGGVSAYLGLAKLMARPTYGIQAQWSGQSTTPLDNIQDLAALYLEEIRKFQTNGPYTLGGWSSGGAIAFEIAYILEKSGEQVDDVIMLDAPTPYLHTGLSQNNIIEWFMEDLALELPLEVLNGVDFEGQSADSSLAKAIELLQPSTAVQLDVNQLLPIYCIFDKVVRLVSDYKPSKASFPVSVVRVEENVVSEFLRHDAQQQPDWGWGDLTHGEVRTTIVEGNHHSFLNERSVIDVHRFIALKQK